METLQHALTQYSGFESYVIFFFLIVVSSIGLFNSDIAFIVSGGLSGLGFFDYRLLIILGFFGILCGDSVTYFAGRKFGRKLIRKRPFSFVLDDQKMDLAENFFKKKGLIIISLTRFLPLTRTSIFLTTGSLRVDLKTFYLLNALSTAIYLPMVIIGSNRASAHISEIIATLRKFQFIPILLIILIGLFFYIKKTRTKKEGAA